MKKIISSLAVLLAFAAVSQAFGPREHATIAVIAQKYLTPQAQAAVDEIFKGEKLAMYSSYPDQYRKTLIIDDAEVPHMFGVQDDVNGDWEMAGDATKNAALALERSIKVLQNYKNASEKDRFQALAIVVHLTGDIHCPSHLRESKEAKSARPNFYIYAKKKIKFHGAWDSEFAAKTFSGGPLDLVYLFDNATPEQRAEIQKGDPRSWASESAKTCYPLTHDLERDEDGHAAVTREYISEHAYLVRTQATKAGYRLAGLLNSIFK